MDTPEARWHAVQTCAEDARFFYGVQTTGVFCLPSCRSRRPRPENVEFFDTYDAAVRAGYRPCKRCRPERVGADRVDEVLVEACRLLGAGGSAQTRHVAAAVGLSNSHFQRRFKEALGITPQQYRRRVLAERGRASLKETDTVTESVYAVGYTSSSRFYEGVARELGMLPAVALRGGSGERVEYALASSSLGAVLVAWTDRGVCEVAIGDSRDAVRRQLLRRLHAARVQEGTKPEWVEAVVRAVDGELASDPSEIPLDIRGTAFQERVWRRLREIPKGETRTYAEIACSLSRPEAARAVAGACASNHLAVLVPCHRVVGKGGRLAGYRWGIERKQILLAREIVEPQDRTGVREPMTEAATSEPGSRSR